MLSFIQKKSSLYKSAILLSSMLTFGLATPATSQAAPPSTDQLLKSEDFPPYFKTTISRKKIPPQDLLVFVSGNVTPAQCQPSFASEVHSMAGEKTHLEISATHGNNANGTAFFETLGNGSAESIHEFKKSKLGTCAHETVTFPEPSPSLGNMKRMDRVSTEIALPPHFPTPATLVDCTLTSYYPQNKLEQYVLTGLSSYQGTNLSLQEISTAPLNRAQFIALFQHAISRLHEGTKTS